MACSIRNVLLLCVEWKLGNIAMPALGTGTGGMEMTVFVELLAKELSEHAGKGATYPKLLRLVVYRHSDGISVVSTLLNFFSQRE